MAFFAAASSVRRAHKLGTRLAARKTTFRTCVCLRYVYDLDHEREMGILQGSAKGTATCGFYRILTGPRRVTFSRKGCLLLARIGMGRFRRRDSFVLGMRGSWVAGQLSTGTFASVSEEGLRLMT